MFISYQPFWLLQYSMHNAHAWHCKSSCMLHVQIRYNYDVGYYCNWPSTQLYYRSVNVILWSCFSCDGILSQSTNIAVNYFDCSFFCLSYCLIVMICCIHSDLFLQDHSRIWSYSIRWVHLSFYFFMGSLPRLSQVVAKVGNKFSTSCIYYWNTLTRIPIMEKNKLIVTAHAVMFTDLNSQKHTIEVVGQHSQLTKLSLLTRTTAW